MRIAADGALRPIPSPPDPLLYLTAVASALLHGLLVASLFVTWGSGGAPLDTRPLEIELIQSVAQSPGSAPSQPQPETPPKPEGEPGPSAAPPPPPTAVNIGNGQERSDPLTVTGDNVVPPAPDARFRNQPPAYPPDAARIGAEGTVHLLLHVSAQGLPLDVEVVQSSGYQSLDLSARRAVSRWRFRPALQDGRPVPFDYELNIHFALGDHP